jgi:uncharacterized protein involved in outer membrane biogenesis
MKKKILIGLGVFVVVTGIVIAVVVANLDKIINSKKGELLATARKQTGREISIGDVGVTLWPGLGARVSDVVIGDDPAYSKEPFVRAKELRVNVKLLPLLQKRVEIKRLVLADPAIVIIKADAKHFNFTSLIAAATPPPAKGQARPAPNSSMAAVLAYADIENGTLHYIDRAAGVDRTIRDIDFTASNVGIGKKLDATLAASVFGDEHDAKIQVSAGPLGDPAHREALRATPLDVKFDLGPVTIAHLMEAGARPGQPAAPPVPGDMKADAELSGTLGEATLKSLNVAATLLGARDPNLKLTASGGPFDFTADSTLVFAHAVLKGALETEPIALGGFKMTSTDKSTPAPVLGGDMRASATFEGNLTALAFNGSIDATNASYEQKDVFSKKSGIPAKATVRGTFRPQHTPGEGIDLEKIDIVLHALTGSGSGRVVPFEGAKAMELSLDAKTPLKPWNELLPAMAPFAISGDATTNVHISSTMAPGAVPNVTGTARFKNLGAKMVDMPRPVSDGEGTVSFTARTANIDDASFRIGESRFHMDLAVTSFQPMQAHYTVSSDQVNRLDVQAPVPGAKPFPRPEVFKNVVATGTLKETAPKVDENELVITSEHGTVSNIDYADFTADVRVTPTVTTIDRYSAKSMGGTLSGSGTMEPKLSKFDITTKVENVNLAEYFKYKAPALTDVLVGRLNADVQVAGQGAEWDAIQKTLTGKGGALVLEGSLLNINIANQIFSSIQGMPLVPPDLTQRMRARNPSLFSENKTVFQNLSSKFTIANGRIQVPDLKLATSDFGLSGDGWFSLAREMNLNSTLTLSKKVASDLVAEVPAAKYILSPDGRIEVPLTLSGSLLKPAVKVDAAGMTAKFQKAMMSQGQQQLQNEVKTGVKGLLDNLNKKKEAPKPAVSAADVIQ